MELPDLRNLSDDELLALARERNEAAFAELMARTSSTSFKLALSILKDRQDAEDEVQNSYWSVWRHVGQFQGDSKFSTWVSRIVINQCLMRLRKLRRARFHYLDETVEGREASAMELRDAGESPEEKVSRGELSAVLRREIRLLPPMLRTVLELRDLEELSTEDVARRLGISIVAAKSRLLRARAELRQRLEKRLRTSGATA